MAESAHFFKSRNNASDPASSLGDHRLEDRDFHDDPDLDQVEFDITYRPGLGGMVDISSELRGNKKDSRRETRNAQAHEPIGREVPGVDAGLGGVGRVGSWSSREENGGLADHYPDAGLYQTMDKRYEEEETYTVESAIDSLGFGWFQWKLSVLCGFAWMADAMEMMILSIISPALHCAWGIASWKQALITTVVFLGMMGGAGMWGAFSDKYGRRAELIFSSVVTLYFGLLSSFSPTFVWILVLRALVGFGVSGGAQAVTLFSEFLPTKQRARAVVGIEAYFALGTAFEVLLALAVMPYLGWRWLLIFSSLPLLLFCIACKWLPESVRYSVAKGNTKQAMETLEIVARTNGKPMPAGRLLAQAGDTKRGRFMDLLAPRYRRTTLMLWAIWFANAFSYYGIVLLTTELFELQRGGSCDDLDNAISNEPTCSLDCHVLSSKDYTDLLWTTVAEIPGLLITLAIIDTLGRRWSMCLEFGVFALFIVLVSVCAGRTAEIIFIFVARAFISGAFQVAYVYTPEVYPTQCRAIGLGACSTFARFGAVITPFIAQVLIKKSIKATVGIYAGVCCIAAILSLLLPIETKGKSLEEKSDTNSPL